MEFSPIMSNTIREEALIEYFLSRMDQINERDLGDRRLAQGIFLLKNRRQFSELAEKRLVPKILQDIDFILKKGWGKHIAESDFFHVHVCGVTKTPLCDLDKLVSEENIRLLYHTLENDFLTPEHADRNIISSFKWHPVVMPIHLNYYKMGDFTFFPGRQPIAISAEEIGLNEYGKIYFEECERGLYQLNNETRLDMKGVLGPWLFPHIKVNYETGEITFEGKTIGVARMR
jgi:hypothetical protein